MSKAIALLHNHGSVIFGTDHMIFSLYGFRPNETHAIHIHEYGDMTNGCVSLGGHYNPTNALHGRHAGDLIFNFTANERGQFYLLRAHHFALEDIYGRSIVIHAFPDDLGVQGDDVFEYSIMPADEVNTLCRTLGYNEPDIREKRHRLQKESLLNGNAGKRICCAIIARAADGH